MTMIKTGVASRGGSSIQEKREISYCIKTSEKPHGACYDWGQYGKR